MVVLVAGDIHRGRLEMDFHLADAAAKLRFQFGFGGDADRKLPQSQMEFSLPEIRKVIGKGHDRSPNEARGARMARQHADIGFDFLLPVACRESQFGREGTRRKGERYADRIRAEAGPARCRIPA